MVVEEARFCYRALATQSLHIQGASPSAFFVTSTREILICKEPHPAASCCELQAVLRTSHPAGLPLLRCRVGNGFHQAASRFVAVVRRLRHHASRWEQPSDQVVRVGLSPLIVGSFCV